LSDSSPKIPETWSTLRRQHTKWARPFVWIEWVTEWAVIWLRRWALLDLVNLIASLSVVWAAISYLTSADERAQAQRDQRKAKQYQAWQVINAGEGKGGSGGRIEALQDLASDNISLKGLNLSKSVLDRLKLPRTILAQTDFSSASLYGACLQGADLREANFQGSLLIQADLSEAVLSRADFSYADMGGADFSKAVVDVVDFRKAVLPESILSAANLRDANIGGARFVPDSSEFFQKALDMGAVCIPDYNSWTSYREQIGKPGFQRRKYVVADCKSILRTQTPKVMPVLAKPVCAQ